ncbi:MAG: TIR domain-containing protein [Gammaproteobacteria bacterium]|nr:TIR domain-containing protein [Gammaproteobacteria bacterium]
MASEHYHAAVPYFTPDDIEKGSRWSNEIAKELEASDIGVLFITQDNLDSAWIMYEAGALSKKLEKSKVLPYLDRGPSY